ncbi:MAG: hypothetical protein JRF02_09625 [Deltaproteobacteria bacterium]|jgi:Co/Zn/Cd efflux system component|nr:hypothetical protein [Deltaproteobacteria bacterium]
MELFGVLIVSPLWGIISPRLFLRSWLGLLGIIASLVFLFQAKAHYRTFFLLFCTLITDMLFSLILLIAGFYILYFHLPFGKTDPEVLVYLIFAMVQLALTLPSVSIRIDQLLQKAKEISSSADGP